MATLTCHTAGCINDGVPIEYPLSGTDEEGNPYSIETVFCGGGCDQPIADIQRTEQELDAQRKVEHHD